MWGRRLGIPYSEYSVMPMGELGDLISAYQISEGVAKEKTHSNDMYIPSLR